MSELKMPDINNVLIAGNLTGDPTFRKTSNGTSVANFYIASNRKYRDNSGIWRENVCYVGIVAWHKLADACNEVLKRGSSILVDGELQSRSWKNEDGTTRNVVEIRARRIQFLDRQVLTEVEETMPDQNSYKDIETEAIEDKPQNDDVNNEELQAGRDSEPNDIKVKPTDFDFGYKNLNL